MTQTKAELLQTRHQGDIRLGDADSTNYVGFKAPATVGTSLVWTLPAADGTANYLLKTDGSGNLGWVADSSTDSTKMPLAGGTFTGDVTFDGATAGRDIVFDRSDNALEFADDAKAIFGTGSDFQIYHNGTDNHIVSTNGQIDIKVASTEDAITAAPNGAVKLYYNNLLRLQTTSDGIQFQSNTADAVFSIRSTAQDGAPTLRFLSDDYDDNADAWRIRADGGGTALGIQNYASGSWEKNIVCQEQGGVELYHDDVKKLETTAQAVKITGGVAQVATAMGALEVDCNTSNYFTKTISGNSTFTFANPAASGQATAFTLELTHSSGTVTWPASVKWNADTAPTLTTGKTHLFMFVTDDGGTRWRGSALVDYVN